jgi:hypothetical protein
MKPTVSHWKQHTHLDQILLGNLLRGEAGVAWQHLASLLWVLSLQVLT